jgi:predicted nucleic acid-binding Zn ribbon protein
MRKANDKSLKEAIEQMLNVYKIKRKYNETAIVSAWPDLVGKSVANRTKEIFIKDKKLFLRIESSVIKNELVMMRNQIIQKINDDAKTELVADIVFL